MKLGEAKIGEKKFKKKDKVKIMKGAGKYNKMKVEIIDNDYLGTGNILLKGKGLAGAHDGKGNMLKDHRVVKPDMIEEVTK